MNADWKLFLERSGAVLAAGKVLHFGDPPGEARRALRGNVLADLSHLGLLSVAGTDSQRLLQGQFTSDLRDVSAERSQLSAWCSPKGRVLVAFRIYLKEDTYYLLLPAALVGNTLKRLQMYVLRADVRLADVSDEQIRVGVAGVEAARKLEAVLGPLPAEEDAAAEISDLKVIRIHGIAPRYEIIGPQVETRELWKTLSDVAAPAGIDGWSLLDVLAGQPNIYPETADAFLPQMVNLQALGGVSFAKGCYAGQEIVARTQHLGKLKRRMYLAMAETSTIPRPGDSLYKAQGAREQSIGEIVRAAPHPEGGAALLAVIQIDAAEDGRVHLEGSEGPALRFQPLPYAL